jgi:hypothetical protein
LRQHWIYEVRFEGGHVEEYHKRSLGLPVCLKRDDVISNLDKGIKRQAFKTKFFSELEERRSNVLKLLQIRGTIGDNLKSWENVFSAILPQTISDEKFTIDQNYRNGLVDLYSEYFSDMQVNHFPLFIVQPLMNFSTRNMKLWMIVQDLWILLIL